ncbi:MAG: Helix-turn-helix domain [Chloroflexi bacterium]|nr:Helix-turn-helix domain [Chloroflexota bacterium]
MTRPVADWITLAEASRILAAANVHIRPETLGRWARSGRLQSIKPGGRRYVRRAQIRALLRPRRRVSVEALQPGFFEDLEE